jgi:hypothetical protein
LAASSLLERLTKVLLGLPSVPVPGRAPDSVESPSEPFEHLLAESIAITRDT